MSIMRIDNQGRQPAPLIFSLSFIKKNGNVLYSERTMPSPSPAIVANLRRLREMRGYSLSALAERAAISKSTLSQLEAGKGNPTIETLWTLANTLGVAFSELLAEGEDGMTVSEPGGGNVQLMARGQESPRVEVYFMRLAPGEVKTSRAHPRGVREHVMVVEGTLRVGALHALAVCRPGEGHEFAADVEHRYEALLDTTRLVVSIVYPHDEVAQ
ncbi:Transcriptional regulator, contains XRE-family HTH domain [Chromohalobacter canadensis]|uniref:Transcriptional regulator, contains XRE-family HTH domain n=2 Tax=Chromohalobacter canadensis TaxID=141389 RepID=A0A285VE70_9GAMM|nr:Transcriptional regulator, contains XRE-family HTH domain [Chromohalobacter canadensis]